jgi:hypothetical protein
MGLVGGATSAWWGSCWRMRWPAPCAERPWLRWFQVRTSSSLLWHAPITGWLGPSAERAGRGGSGVCIVLAHCIVQRCSGWPRTHSTLTCVLDSLDAPRAAGDSKVTFRSLYQYASLRFGACAEPSPVQPLTRQGMDPVMALARSSSQQFRGQLALQLSLQSSQHASAQPAGFAGVAPSQAAASSQPAQEAAGSFGHARLSQASSAGSEQQVVVPLGGRQELRRAVSRENAAEGPGQGSGERWANVPL